MEQKTISLNQLIQRLDDQIKLRQLWRNLATEARHIQDIEPEKAQALLKTLETSTQIKLSFE